MTTKTLRADLRECELCGRRFRVMMKGRAKYGKRRKVETEATARARHRRDPMCQSIAVERFAEANGWMRVGRGAHVGALRNSDYTIHYLPCNVGDDPDTGARVNTYTAFASRDAVEAVRALTGVRVSAGERAAFLRALGGDTKALRALTAARRLGGVSAVRDVVRAIAPPPAPGLLSLDEAIQ